MTTFLNTPDDMEWLEQVHHIPVGYGSAMLYGTEDAPDKVEVWLTDTPEYDQPPDETYYP